MQLYYNIYVYWNYTFLYIQNERSIDRRYLYRSSSLKRTFKSKKVSEFTVTLPLPSLEENSR